MEIFHLLFQEWAAAVIGILLNLCIPNNKPEKKKLNPAETKEEKETVEV